MKYFSTKFFPLLVSLLVLLVTGQGLASGLVLCIGENGHSAYEQAAAGKCAPVESSCLAEEECVSSACTHDHCGPCQDFATTSDSLHGRSRGDIEAATPLPLPTAAAVASPTITASIREPTANLLPLPPPVPSTALVALRTVVLLN